MKTITREELKKKMDNNEELTIVEVLGEESFNKFHLPGAINVPVNDGFEKQIQQTIPNKNQAVVVYCANKDCPASPNAAKKMDALGYQEVYDYEEGKEDWQQAGLSVES